MGICLIHWLKRSGVARAIATDGCIFPISSTNTCHNSQQSPLITIHASPCITTMRPKMLQMIKSKQSSQNQAKLTLYFTRGCRFGGLPSLHTVLDNFSAMKRFLHGIFWPGPGSYKLPFWDDVKIASLYFNQSFLCPRTAQISAAAKRKAGSKAESFEIRSRTRFGPWFSWVNQCFDLHEQFPGILTNWQLVVVFQEKKTTPVCITWLLL